MESGELAQLARGGVDLARGRNAVHAKLVSRCEASRRHLASVVRGQSGSWHWAECGARGRA